MLREAPGSRKLPRTWHRVAVMRAAIAGFIVLLAATTPACSSEGVPAAADSGSAENTQKTATSAPPVAARLASSAPAGAPTATGANVLKNPGFESGRDGWSAMGGQNWGAFDIVDAPVHGGLHSARLAVAGLPDAPEKAKVYGVVQEVRRDELPGDFPDVVSGWYRVNEWNKPATGADMYLQVVVIIWGDPRASALIGQPAGQKPITNYQIRFYLAGLVEPAFRLSNARLDFVTKGEPKQDEWVRFEIPVKEKFQQLWGTIPADYEFIRILFEARWDNKAAGTAVSADVTYDDLYFGYGKPPDSPR